MPFIYLDFIKPPLYFKWIRSAFCPPEMADCVWSLMKGRRSRDDKKEEVFGISEICPARQFYVPMRRLYPMACMQQCEHTTGNYSRLHSLWSLLPRLSA